MTRFTLFFINLLLFATFSLQAQNLEEDNNIIFMKANVLFDTDRYDEAVRLYNRIIKDDPSFSRAIFMRGKAKFALGAFKGTKSDILEYIDQRGVNADVIELMANTELKLKNERSALSYIQLLTKLNPYEGKYFAKAGDLLFKEGNKNKACEFWIQSAKLGDSEGAKNASIKCAYDHSIHLPSKPKTQSQNQIPSQSPAKTNETFEVEHPDVLERDTVSIDAEPEIIDVSVKTTSPHIDMNASQDIIIDEELTLTINSGLGDRQVDQLPNILMLSDQSGKVVLDLCVDDSGKVASAELNSKLSTIFRSSLSSLAIRKAKQLIFMPSLIERQCGLLVFSIDTKA